MVNLRPESFDIHSTNPGITPVPVPVSLLSFLLFYFVNANEIGETWEEGV